MPDRADRIAPISTLLMAPILAVAMLGPAPALAQKSFGAGTGSGPIMTRDELRECIKQQKALGDAVATFEKAKADLEADRVEILKTKQAVDAQTGSVKADVSQVNEVNARTEALSKRVSEWNESWQAFEKADRSGPMAERDRRRLLTEKRNMEKEEQALNAQRAALGGAGSGASQVNTQVDALNARTAAWNERNKRVAKMGEDLTQERDLWASECGNRRYREDDEIAIRNER